MTLILTIKIEVANSSNVVSHFSSKVKNFLSFQFREIVNFINIGKSTIQ